MALDFHVTKKIFDMVEKGKKHREYREHKDYWKKRFDKVNLPAGGHIYNGYSSEKIPIIITNITLIRSASIDNPFYRSFINTPLCFCIKYSLNTQV